MPHRQFESKGVAVPSGRLSRLARFGGMAGGIAGGMLLDGAKQLAQGKRPSVSDLLLTPANAIKVTHQLSQLRGAVMMVGPTSMLATACPTVRPPEKSDGHCISMGMRMDAS